MKKLLKWFFPKKCFHEWESELKIAYARHLYYDSTCKKCGKNECRIIWH